MNEDIITSAKLALYVNGFGFYGSSIEELRAALQSTAAELTAIADTFGQSATKPVKKTPPKKDAKAEPAPEQADEGNEPAPTAADPSPTSSNEPATPTAESAPARSDDGDAKELTYDDVKDAVLKLVSERGQSVAKAVIATFGVNTAKELAPEQWGEAIAALTAAFDEEVA